MFATECEWVTTAGLTATVEQQTLDGENGWRIGTVIIPTANRHAYKKSHSGWSGLMWHDKTWMFLQTFGKQDWMDVAEACERMAEELQK
jgi:hypothetical protein